jgi:SAM-dependent methyltransferase
MPGNEDVLSQQLAYYRARAQEYDESVQLRGRFSAPGMPDVDREWHHVASTLQALPRVQSAMELACGTGLWTKILLTVSDSLVAVDGAQEMLDVNHAKLSSSRVTYQLADLFNWKASQDFDLVFFAFWISHVPGSLMEQHLAEVAKSVKPGGRLFILDEPSGGKQLSGPSDGGEQTRTLHSGASFRIVKVYPDPDELAAKLKLLGFKDIHVWHGDYYFYINAVKSA